MFDVLLSCDLTCNSEPTFSSNLWRFDDVSSKSVDVFCVGLNSILVLLESKCLLELCIALLLSKICVMFTF